MREARGDPRARWALSFADLTLLLLGFFVLLQAQGSGGWAMTDGVRAALGEAPLARSLDLAAADLFEPGEAVLRPAARRRLAAFGGRGGGMTVTSIGRGVAARRFDAWELAAARTAAVARGIAAGGMAEDRVAIEIGRGGEGPQRLHLVRR